MSAERGMVQSVCVNDWIGHECEQVGRLVKSVSRRGDWLRLPLKVGEIGLECVWEYGNWSTLLFSILF